MVRANVANAEGLLRPAMLASAEILTSAESAAAAVPETSIVREGEQAHVWLVRANNILEERAIITGRHNGSLTEVRQGLTVGERIVTGGSLFIDGVAQAD
jgi:cobalt-zinc-cadmium efflux system membrane fusion protein